MDQLSVNEKIGSNYVLFELSGAITGYTMGEFKEKLYQYIVDINVVLDLSNITHIDSAAMGMLMAAFNDGIDCGTKEFFLNPSDRARYAIEKTGFYDTFYIIHSVTEVSDEK